jgi:tripartite-type tricarboxylate transporter receptor subunit TctC
MPTQFSPSRRRFALSVAAGCSLPVITRLAYAQEWPSKPVHIIVPFAPGGASDAIARIVSEQLGRRLGQPVIIENKPGGSTIVGVDTVAKAAPDGHTVLLAGVGSFSVLPALRKKLPFDIERDLALLGLLAYTPNILVTGADKPYRTLADFVNAAKANPRKIRYVTYGDGSANHLCGVLLERAANIELDGIPYKGAADAKLALLRGDVDLSFETLNSCGADLKGGRLRALAHGGSGRTQLMPDLPGLAELGYAQAAVQPYFGMAAPAGTPQPVRERLAKELREIMAQPDVRDRCAAAYLEPATAGASEMTAIVQRDTATFRRIAQQLKLSLD